MAFLEDLRVAQEGILSLGFWALQVYRLGHLRYRFQSRLVRYPLGAVHLVLAKLAEMFCGVTIGVSAQIGRRLVIEHSGAIVVHGKAVIGDDCIIFTSQNNAGRHTHGKGSGGDVRDHHRIGADVNLSLIHI